MYHVGIGAGPGALWVKRQGGQVLPEREGRIEEGTGQNQGGGTGEKAARTEGDGVQEGTGPWGPRQQSQGLLEEGFLLQVRGHRYRIPLPVLGLGLVCLP